MEQPRLITNKGKVFRRSLTLRMLELGFAITVFELLATYLSGQGTPKAMVFSAACQFAAWIGRFILQPKISGDTNGS